MNRRHSKLTYLLTAPEPAWGYSIHIRQYFTDIISILLNCQGLCWVKQTMGGAYEHMTWLITFRARFSRGKMYASHGRLCVSLSDPRRIPTLLHGPGCNLGNCRGCSLVVHYWADLQSVHGYHYYDSIVPNAKCQWVLVLEMSANACTRCTGVRAGVKEAMPFFP